MTTKSLLQSDSNAEVCQRIESLTADSSRQWGKMTVAQMLAHCQKPFLVAGGDMQLKRALIGLLFGRLAKKKFVDSDAPFGKNSPTDPRFLIPDASDVAKEQAELVALVKRFGEAGALTEVHPFFGRMSGGDWDRLLWKHLDHHLRQFGA